MIRKCARFDCMKEFEPKVVNQIYCSTNCYKKSCREQTDKRHIRMRSDKKKLEYFYRRTG